jgi:hypothetical protein
LKSQSLKNKVKIYQTDDFNILICKVLPGWDWRIFDAKFKTLKCVSLKSLRPLFVNLKVSKNGLKD